MVFQNVVCILRAPFDSCLKHPDCKIELVRDPGAKDSMRSNESSPALEPA